MRSHQYEINNAIEPASAPTFAPATGCTCHREQIGGHECILWQPARPVHPLQSRWVPQPALSVTRSWREVGVSHGKGGGRRVRGEGA